MYDSCMAPKTISLTLDAYERLRRAKENPGESLSEVVMRARWDSLAITAGEFLKRVREGGLPTAPSNSIIPTS